MDSSKIKHAFEDKKEKDKKTVDEHAEIRKNATRNGRVSQYNTLESNITEITCSVLLLTDVACSVPFACCVFVAHSEDSACCRCRCSGCLVYKTPLVLGTDVASIESIEMASRSASATALKADSARWWSFSPRSTENRDEKRKERERKQEREREREK